ncbi:hypothetical protein MKW92_007495 [Papaver armeniacum]|nr:hypothetical protein MKW92_007495 [Papaver armeniacum]
MSSGFVAMNFNMSHGVNLLSAVVPLLKLISLTMIGLILAHPICQNASFVFALFLPCLIFTQLGKSITLEGLRTWWFVYCCHDCALGILGICLLLSLGSVCHSTDNPFGPDCHTNGIAYVFASQWVAVILVYTLVYHMMEPPMEYYDIVDEGMRDEEITRDLSLLRSLTAFSNFSHQSMSDSDVDAPMASGASSPKSVRCLAEPKMVRRIRPVAEQTPVHAPLAFVTDSLEILAGAMVPSGPNDSKLGIKTIVGVSVARLVVLPVLGIGIVALADKMNILVNGDQMYRFVLLLQYTTPTAILLGAIASLRGYAHVFGILSLSVYITIYFKLLSYV